ncbi:MAG: hypothetical protein NVS3B18_02790 [Candidatus Dormibacteria bacterium]
MSEQQSGDQVSEGDSEGEPEADVAPEQELDKPDQDVADTFPASDPPAASGTT